MLYALVLLGLLPAMLLMGGPDESEDEGDDAPAEGGTGGSLDMLDGGADDADPPGKDDAADLVVDGQAGETTVEGFRPGVDTLTVKMPGTQDSIFALSTTSAGGAPGLLVDGTDFDCLVSFPGLSEVPYTDIRIEVTDEETGATIAYGLGAFSAGSGGDDAPEGGEGAETLDPVPGDLGDELAGGEGEDGLPPLPGDDEDELAGDTGADPLDPVDSVIDEIEAMPAEGLEALLVRDSDAYGRAGDVEAGPVTALGDGDDVHAGDAIASTLLGLDNGAPMLGGTPSVVDAGGGNDTVTTAGGAYAFGGAGDDILADTAGASALYGGAGQDTLTAGPGGGFLDGGSGDDVLTGGDGNDIIEGGAHRPGHTDSDDDILEGGAGDDILRGGFGADVLSGGDGNDVIDHHGRAEERLAFEHHEFAWHQDDAVDRLDGGAGDDLLIMGAGDIATGGEGADTFRLYAGSDPAEILDFTPGEDFLRVTLDPGAFASVPPVEVRATEDGLDAEVVVGDEIVAILRGAPGATTDDIYVEVVPDVAA